MNPLVSVIVPTRNRPAMLTECLRSIDRQTYENVEIIVVNDGGEPVRDIVDEMGLKRVVHLVDHRLTQGPAAARNSGIRAANGTYIAYLDDDDVYYPNHVGALVQYLENHGSFVVYSDAVRAVQCKVREGYRTEKLEDRYCQDFDAEKLFVSNYIPIICAAHHRDCVLRAGYFDETLFSHEDWDFFIRLSALYYFGHVSEITCEYRWRYDDSSATVRKRVEFLDTIRIIHDRYRQGHWNKRIVRRQKIFLMKQMLSVGLWKILIELETATGTKCRRLRRYLL